MIVDKERIFSEFYELKKTTSIPLQAFIQRNEMRYITFPKRDTITDGIHTEEEKMEWKKNRFYREYMKWVRKHHKPTITTTTEQFLSWICNEYHKDTEPVLVYYNKNTYRLKGQSLSVAVSVFNIVYPDIDKNDLALLCGVSVSTIDTITKNHRT